MKSGHRVSIPNFICVQSPLIALLQFVILHHISAICKMGIAVFAALIVTCDFVLSMV